MTGMKQVAGIAAAWVLVLTATSLTPAQTPETARDSSRIGRTEPWEKRNLSFQLQGTILETAVKEGDRIQQGQLIVKLDDRVEQKEFERLQLDAKDEQPIKEAKTVLAQKEIDLGRKQKAFDTNVASPQELDEAKLGRDLAEIKLAAAQSEQAQKKLRADQAGLRVEQMKLLSPIAGIVEKLHLQTGELCVPDSNRPVVTVVKNDPLKVEVFLPVKAAGQLGLGETLQVQHEGEKEWETAKVIYLAPVADAASGTRQVKLELPNPKNRESGLTVTVKLPEKLAGGPAGQ